MFASQESCAAALRFRAGTLSLVGWIGTSRLLLEPRGLQPAKRKEQFMGDKANNLQDVFLNAVRKTRTPVTMFLMNGVKLQGVITWFDNFSVLLRRDGHSQLVYKHAISTVMPAAPLQLFEGDKGDHGEDGDEGDED